MMQQFLSSSSRSCSKLARAGFTVRSPAYSSSALLCSTGTGTTSTSSPSPSTSARVRVSPQAGPSMRDILGSSTGGTASIPRAMALTKIVATIGPTSEQHPMMQNVVDAGLRIMRINFSHATYEEADLRVKNLASSKGLSANKGLTDSNGRHVNHRAVMLDTQGPEIRTGMFEGVKEVALTAGETIVVTTDPALRTKQSKERIWVSYTRLPQAVKVGGCVLLANGEIELKVIEKLSDTEVRCEIVNSSSLGNKKGVNLPDAVVDLPAIVEKDKADIRWGAANDIDFIAASFTRKAADVHEIRSYAAQAIRELPESARKTHSGVVPHIIAKIENVEALDNFDEILEAADGIMVARGDLGVEIPMETLTNIQKMIVRKCNQAGKPVVVATQMLESMIKAPRPTRAECTDVANAVFDGADCVMLSGESAQGKYPSQSVATMQRIVVEAERFAGEFGSAVSVAVNNTNNGSRDASFLSGVVRAASSETGVSCIVVLGHSGRTAHALAAHKPTVPVLCLLPFGGVRSVKAAKQLQVRRAVHPVVPSESDPLAQQLRGDSSNRYEAAVEYAKKMGFCKPGDSVVVVAAEKANSGSSMTLRVVNLA